MTSSYALTTSALALADKLLFVVHNETSGGNVASSTTSIYTGEVTNNYTTIFEANTTTVPPECFKSSLAEISVTHGLSQAKIITVLVMLILFSLFGSLGNGLVLYVFSKKSDKVTSTIFILALAWTDFFTCLFFMPFTTAYIGLNSRMPLDFFCKLYLFFNTCIVPLSAFIMVAIAVDRYFSICHPFMHVITPRRARGALVTLALFAFTLGSITACMYTSYKSDNPTDHLKSNHSQSYNETANIGLYFTPNPAVLMSTQNITDHSEHTLYSSANNISSRWNFTPIWSLNGSPHQVEDGCPDVDIEGLCILYEDIFSNNFIDMYQKVYISFYAISLLAVFFLYFLIYRSVAKRRAWRRKQKSWSHSPMTQTGAVTIDPDNGNNFNDVFVGDGENLELSPQNVDKDSAVIIDHKDNDVGDNNSSQNIVKTPSARKVMAARTVKPICPHENGLDSCQMNSSVVDKKLNRERRDFNFLANIRTAIMLFVVALVFILSFLPAWLMATQIINYEIIVFYMHFFYNIANPIIYAFMNQSFRKEVRKVFQRDCGLKCCSRRQRFSSERNHSRCGATAISICDSPVEGKVHSPIYKSPSTDS